VDGNPVNGVDPRGYATYTGGGRMYPNPADAGGSFIPSTTNAYTVYGSCMSWAKRAVLTAHRGKTVTNSKCWQNWQNIPPKCQDKKDCWKDRCNAEALSSCAKEAKAAAEAALRANQTHERDADIQKVIDYYNGQMVTEEVYAYNAYLCNGTPLW
jgi:hypothetical protein